MIKIAFFDAKPYDRDSFAKAGGKYELRYFENRLSADTAPLAAGCEAVCAFVNDELSAGVLEQLSALGVRAVALRCAGYSNVDFKAAYEKKITVMRVPAYSPHAVAEHAMALLLAVDRKLCRAYNRTRDFNFSLSGLVGSGLYGKTAGVVGTGKIGRAFIDICRGFGMRVVAYDPFPAPDAGIDYLPLDELWRASDVISLHCPLTPETHHIAGREAFGAMKDGVFFINTSRGALVDSGALLEALNSGRVRGAGLDVYEEEAEYFFTDLSGTPVKDDTLSLLLTRPNVILTSHQAFLTDEALDAIARTTAANLDAFFSGGPLENEICYRCKNGGRPPECRAANGGRCFR